MVVFVDPGEVMDPVNTPNLYSIDIVHPTPEGSAAIGALVADTIEANGGL